MTFSVLASRLSAVTLSVLVLGWTGSPAQAESRPARTVLTIHTGAEEFPSNPVLDAAIREALKSRPDAPITYFAEYVESDSFGEELASQSIADYIREKYRNRRIDVVIAITNVALRLVLDHRDLFPDVPIVFGGLAVPDEHTRRAGAGIAALKVERSYVETLDLALDLHPSTEQVFVVAKSPNEANAEAVHTALESFSKRVKVTYLAEATTDALLAAVRAAPPQSLILHIWHRNEAPSNDVSPADMARFVAEASPVPVYGTVDANIGTGIVGGVVREVHETGVQLGTMARQILDGKHAQDFPVEGAPIVPTFDWRQLQRWGIDVSKLPPGSAIQFRTATPWETYRRYIIGAVILIAAQALLIGALLAQQARRRRAEEMILEREATLRDSYGRIRQLTGRIINEQETARAEIARDLHDDICQRLTYVSMSINGLRESLHAAETGETQQAFEELEHDTQGVFDGIRRLSHELHPTSLRLLGLAPTLKRHCGEIEKRHHVQVTFHTQGSFEDLHPDVGIGFFRIAQESLRNGLVHGAANRFRVSLLRLNDEVELEVVDYGRGFDLQTVRRAADGLGLVTMEERARILGGDLRIVTAPGKGTTIRLRAPARKIESATESPEAVEVEASISTSLH